MHRGYIKLWRKVAQNDLWTAEPFTRGQAWLDLLMITNHKPGAFWVRGVKVEVGRGQMARSDANLATRWQWSRGKVRRFLSMLEADQMIVQQKSNVTTLITICCYDDYQADGTADDTEKTIIQQQPEQISKSTILTLEIHLVRLLKSVTQQE